MSRFQTIFSQIEKERERKYGPNAGVAAKYTFIEGVYIEMNNGLLVFPNGLKFDFVAVNGAVPKYWTAREAGVQLHLRGNWNDLEDEEGSILDESTGETVVDEIRGYVIVKERRIKWSDEPNRESRYLVVTVWPDHASYVADLVANHPGVTSTPSCTDDLIEVILDHNPRGKGLKIAGVFQVFGPDSNGATVKLRQYRSEGHHHRW